MKTAKERILLYSCRYSKPSRLAVLLLSLLYAGCMSTPVVRHESLIAADETADATTADYYLAMLYRFNNADPIDQAALYERVSTDAVLDPTAANRLQLALLKAWPGHPGHNPEAAQQMLQTALMHHYELTPEVENLARVYLLLIDQQLQASNRSRTLAMELEEARQKLEALTTIEQTVETPSPRAEAAP